MSSQSRFGYEWNRYAAMTPEYEGQFRNWTHPMRPEDWRGKRFMDAGCGMGRNSYWPLKWGAASAVAFDFDERSVTRARETLGDFPNAEVLFKSIYEIDWQDEFDIVLSIGVIHHLHDPRKALANLARALRPDGYLLIWVYSYEGNEWIVRCIDPIRTHISSKLPVHLVHALAYFCSIPLYILLKLLHGPTTYLRQLSQYRFWHVHSIVFDQLIPDVANYWKKEEVRGLVSGLPLTHITVESPPNRNGWILRAKKY